MSIVFVLCFFDYISKMIFVDIVGMSDEWDCCIIFCMILYWLFLILFWGCMLGSNVMKDLFVVDLAWY